MCAFKAARLINSNSNSTPGVWRESHHVGRKTRKWEMKPTRPPQPRERGDYPKLLNLGGVISEGEQEDAQAGGSATNREKKKEEPRLQERGNGGKMWKFNTLFFDWLLVFFMLALIKQTVFLCLCVLRFGDVVKLPKTASRILSFFSFLN